jgi:hypothetical protein
MSRGPVRLLTGLLFIVALAGAAVSSAAPDWESVAGERTVTVETSNEDGSVRYTTIWLVVLDGQGFIRTGNTTWGANVERNPEIMLRIGESNHALRAEFIQAEGVRERVMQSFREKYGWQDVLSGLIRGSNPKLMRLVDR